MFRDQSAEMVKAIIRPFGRGSHRTRSAWWYRHFSGLKERLNRSPSIDVGVVTRHGGHCGKDRQTLVSEKTNVNFELLHILVK
jgi:hypothetical protein